MIIKLNGSFLSDNIFFSVHSNRLFELQLKEYVENNAEVLIIWFAALKLITKSNDKMHSSIEGRFV